MLLKGIRKVHIGECHSLKMVIKVGFYLCAPSKDGYKGNILSIFSPTKVLSISLSKPTLPSFSKQLVECPFFHFVANGKMEVGFGFTSGF